MYTGSAFLTVVFFHTLYCTVYRVHELFMAKRKRLWILNIYRSSRRYIHSTYCTLYRSSSIRHFWIEVVLTLTVQTLQWKQASCHCRPLYSIFLVPGRNTRLQLSHLPIKRDMKSYREIRWVVVLLQARWNSHIFQLTELSRVMRVIKTWT